MTALDPARLVEQAVAETGIDDVEVGDAEFVECLTAFCDALRTESRLSETGVAATEFAVVRTLTNRLRFHRDLRDHPEILDEELVPPIVVVGLPRSGTTKVQRILSVDPGVQRLEFWRMMYPSRVAGAEPDPRIAMADAMVQGLTGVPSFVAAHPTRVREADEDLLLYEMTFDSWVTVSRYRTRAFFERALARPVRPSYAYVRSLLQYLQWQDGGSRGRPWVLKTPVHLGHLPVLLENYPGATIVHCHRDPRVTIPSFIRLLEVLHGLYTDQVDLDLITEQSVEYWSAVTTQCLQDRDAGLEANVVDVTYEDIRDDVNSVVRAVYRAAGRDLSPSLAEQLGRREREDAYHEVGKHEYSLERYGLTDAVIEERFADYLSRFFPTKTAV